MGKAVEKTTLLTRGSAVPGLIIGGTGSNAGKTVFTLALLCALQRRGLVTAAAKTGPDYIDAAFHASLTGRPAANLDAWMCREAPPSPREKAAAAPHPGLRRTFERMTVPDAASGTAPDLLVVEGAMGLYDGGHRGAGSTARLAAQLDLPVLLTLNAAGLGQSAAAVAEGFLRHCPPWGREGLRFLGMVCTCVGSGRHADMLRRALAPTAKACRVPLLGLLPRQGAPELRSRHLGLVEAREALPAVDREALALWLETHCDLHRLLRLLDVPQGRAVAPATGRHAPPAPVPNAAPDATRFFSPRRPRGRKRRPLVGMAWDAAFSFCYADLPALLAELGADVVTFSPLRDAAPPNGCAGLYFPGGYPELHAERLSANSAMREALQARAARGLPMYGECGGYIYLMRGVTAAGRTHAMSGLLPRSCTLCETRAALGYRAAQALPGWPASATTAQQTAAPRALWVRGHEFHYAREDAPSLPPDADGRNGAPLWRLHDSRGVFLRDEGCRCGSVAGAWLHCYPEGSRSFWRAWLRSLAVRA